jgi:hypothetical protein
MQDGDVIELMTISGFDVSARRTGKRVEVEVKVPITCPAAVTLAGILFGLGAFGIFLLLLGGEGEVLIISGIAIDAAALEEAAQLIAKGVAFGTLVTFLAKFVCKTK